MVFLRFYRRGRTSHKVIAQNGTGYDRSSQELWRIKDEDDSALLHSSADGVGSQSLGGEGRGRNGSVGDDGEEFWQW